MDIDIMENVFQAYGTPTTVVDGVEYAQPLNAAEWSLRRRVSQTKEKKRDSPEHRKWDGEYPKSGPQHHHKNYSTVKWIHADIWSGTKHFHLISTEERRRINQAKGRYRAKKVPKKFKKERQQIRQGAFFARQRPYTQTPRDRDMALISVQSEAILNTRSSQHKKNKKNTQRLKPPSLSDATPYQHSLRRKTRNF